MDDHSNELIADDHTFWGHHRIALLVVSSIVVSLMLVAIALALYASSGAALLDASRPGLKDVNGQTADADDGFEDYPEFGTIDQNSIDEFQRLYDQQAAKSKAVDAFSGDPLNPDALEISAPAVEN